MLHIDTQPPFLYHTEEKVQCPSDTKPIFEIYFKFKFICLGGFEVHERTPKVIKLYSIQWQFFLLLNKRPDRQTSRQIIYFVYIVNYVSEMISLYVDRTPISREYTMYRVATYACRH